MGFEWTGSARDSSGQVRRSGFELTLLGLRISTFPVPTKEFGVMNRRIVVELGPLHALLTWNRHR